MLKFTKALRYYTIKNLATELYFNAGGWLCYLNKDTSNLFYSAANNNVLRWLSKLGDKTKIYVDVGACVGDTSIPVADSFAYTYCFEPVPKNYSILLRNVAANNCRDIISFNVGLSNSFHSELFSDSYATSKRDVEGVVVVHLRTGDSYELSNVAVMKIDVEGAEYEVLEGFEKTIDACKPALIIERNDEYPDIHLWLLQKGYTVTDSDSNNDLYEHKERIK